MQVTREIQCAEQNRSISMSRIPSSLTIEYVLQEMTVKYVFIFNLKAMTHCIH